ncbi:MAG: cytochrome c [Propionivibrio sp.]|jgi:mono/diheme cytochrome c family protein|nr:cytochrome c [Propionivibrio sp.]
MTRFLLCLLPLWLFAVPAHALTGDSMRGEKLHAKCLDCHGTGLYAPDKRKIVSLKALRKDVKRWGTYYAPALTDQEVEDITTWLNEKFYKF